MKPIDKKDMPKLIALIVMAVGVMGYFVLQVLTASGTASASANSTGAKAAAASSASGTTAATAAAAAGADAAALTQASMGGAGINLLTTGRDPFTPTGPVALFIATGGGSAAGPRPAAPAARPANAEPPVSVAYSPAARRLDRVLGLPQSYPRPGLPAGGWAELNGVNASAPEPGSGGAVSAVAVAPVKAVPVLPPPPPFTVTGVVLGGSRDVAILRGGSGPAAAASDRRFVTVGDPVGNGFVVAAIDRSGVEIKSGQRRFTLKIGKSGEESRAN